ncbi:hypothetical protein [Sphingomonas sp. GB1N7]|uniref:hypothetical protein n=1 Tax=Parasphingomonas caseinilytica TaxID=3096158 RepID=UPI002FCB179E
MRDIKRRSRLEQMVSSLDDVIMFAEQENDFVRAAKCEDVRLMIAARLESLCD